MKRTLTKELTKGEIRESALKELSYKGYQVWRQNNIAVKGRKFIGRLGVADIMGFDKNTGRVVACEIKTVNDRLSDDQKEFLTDVKKANGIALIAKQSETGAVVLEPW